jgi:hypothetical protein
MSAADGHVLWARFEKVLEFAAASGADAKLLQETSDTMLEALIELAAWRAGDMDQRVQRSLELARKIERLRASGLTVEQISQRLGKKERHIYRLRKRLSEHEDSISMVSIPKSKVTDGA